MWSERLTLAAAQLEHDGETLWRDTPIMYVPCKLCTRWVKRASVLSTFTKRAYAHKLGRMPAFLSSNRFVIPRSYEGGLPEVYRARHSQADMLCTMLRMGTMGFKLDIIMELINYVPQNAFVI